jgi:thiamine-monophosphate kinase
MPDNGFPSNEYELIRRIQARLPDPRHISPPPPYELTIGDDAAVRINKTAGERLVITTDILVENVHFSLDSMTFEEIGYKAMVSNLSDCAAMGARADGAVVQVVFPMLPSTGSSIEKIYAGFAQACEKWGFPIVGGDLSRGPVWTIGITLTGSVPPGGRILTRTGIKDGDALWVTGMPGMSAAGLAAIRRFRRQNVPAPYRPFINAHISPTPRITEGQALAACQPVHAMMDLSDGLSKDAATLCYENGLGFIFAPNPAPPPAMIDLANDLARDWRDWFYHGGEEYELLFACAPDFDPSPIIPHTPPLLLGHFTADSSGLRVGLEALGGGGWDHCLCE